MSIGNNVKKVVTNGKTKATLWAGIPIATVIFLSLRFGGVEGQVKTNVEDIKEFKGIPIKVGKIETQVEELQKDFDKFDMRQEKQTSLMQDILREVKK